MKNKIMRHRQSPDNQRQSSVSCEKKNAQKNKLIPHSQKTDVSSLIFQSARNSLCAGSPKIQDKGNEFFQKYKTYIQFISTGKVMPESRNSYHQVRTTTRNQILAKPHSSMFSKKKGALTPTPKRNSHFSMANQQGRKSSCDKYSETRASNGFQQLRQKQIIKIQKPFDEKQHNFIVKGKILKNSPHSKFVNTSSENRNNAKGVSDKKKQLQLNKVKKEKNDDKNPKGNAPAHKRKNSKHNLANNQNSKSKQQKSSINASINNEQDIDAQQQEICRKLFKGIEFYRDLGKGAHALVRSAVDWNKKRKIAVKVYDKSQLTNDQLKSIERQIQILMKLSQENIIKLYEIIQTYKTINLMMEYGGGNSLEQYMRSRPEGYLSEDEARHIFTQVCRATAYLHDHNIAHRDLKTQNILLNKHLQLKIIDFGFSLQSKPGEKIASYCGTPTYMAPEVVSKTPHDPLLSDRWSLGILLFTMLNGHCPFKAPSQKQLFEKICMGAFEYLVDISDSARLLIESFLKKQPQQRLTPSKALQSKWIGGYQTISVSNPGSLQSNQQH